MSDQSTVRILGTLRTDDGGGVVRLEDRFETDIEDLWSALTEPERLARWLGEVDGDLRVGGEYRAHYFASGWEGTCRVEVCDRPHRILISAVSETEPDGSEVELRLTADGDGTVLVIEDRGVPVENIAAYGAGDQIHLEDLASYLSGGEPCDPRARFEVLFPTYQELPVE